MTRPRRVGFRVGAIVALNRRKLTPATVGVVESKVCGSVSFQIQRVRWMNGTRTQPEISDLVAVMPEDFARPAKFLIVKQVHDAPGIYDAEVYDAETERKGRRRLLAEYLDKRVRYVALVRVMTQHAKGRAI